jgi:hypothetical protein
MTVWIGILYVDSWFILKQAYGDDQFPLAVVTLCNMWNPFAKNE